MKNHRRGFIALITTIIISLVLLTFVVAVGFSGFFGRFGILDSEVNERSAALAEACVEVAALELSQDEDYGGDRDVVIGSGSCHICPVTGPGNRTVLIQAVASNAYTNLEVVIEPATGDIVSWEEIPTVTVSGSVCTES